MEFEDRPDLEGEGGGASAYIGQHDVDVDGEIGQHGEDEDQNDDNDEHQGGRASAYDQVTNYLGIGAQSIVHFTAQTQPH